MFAPLLIAAALSSSANPPSPQRDSSRSIAAGRQWLQSSPYFLKIGQSDIEVDIQLQPLSLQTDAVLQWVRQAAESVTTYYGRFPFQRVRVSVAQIEDRDESIHGTTWGDIDGFHGVSRMTLGAAVSETDLEADWTMTHEMCTWESLHSPKSTIGLRKVLRPTLSQSQERKMANYLRKKYGAIWSRECLRESLNEATEGSTGRTPGAARTGEAQCSAWSRMWRFGERPVIGRDYRMPFVPSLRQGLRSIPNPRCHQFFT